MNHQIAQIAAQKKFLLVSVVIKTSPAESLPPETWSEFISKRVFRDEMPAEGNYDSLWTERAPFYAEFSKIESVAVNFYRYVAGGSITHSARLYTGTETKILNDFSEFLKGTQTMGIPVYLLGHNISDFNIPFLCRRYALNQLPIPAMIDYTARKSKWDKGNILDTMEMWGFDQWRHNISLKLLCGINNVSSDTVEESALHDSYLCLKLFVKWMGGQHDPGKLKDYATIKTSTKKQ